MGAAHLKAGCLAAGGSKLCARLDARLLGSSPVLDCRCGSGLQIQGGWSKVSQREH